MSEASRGNHYSKGQARMRVLLIQPPMLLHKLDIGQFGHPLGLAYIAAVLRQNGCEVSILDSIIFNPKGRKEGDWIHIGLDWDGIRDKMLAYGPQIVGISSMFTSQAECAHKVAKLVKDNDRSIITVVGGVHPSAAPQEVLSDNSVDYVVLGEGEMTMMKLVQYLERPSSFDLNKIDGIAYRQGDHIIVNPRVSSISDLNSLPFPAWDLLDMKRYAKHKGYHGPVVKNTPIFSISSSRGCPLHCIFCSVGSVWGRKWRARDAKNVVDEMEVLVKEYGVKEIDFVDDGLLVSSKRMDEICDEIVKRGLHIPWAAPNGVNINSVRYETLKRMKESGCYSVNFGIESGNQYIRDKLIRKPILVQHAKDVVRWCRDLNIWTNAFFVLGIPGENERTFSDTISFSLDLDTDSASFSVIRLVPGTELARLCEEKGYVERDNLSAKSKIQLHLVRTEAFTPRDLEMWRKKAYRRYTWHVFTREVFRLNLVRRLLKMRSAADLRLYLRIGIGGFKRVIGLG